MLGNLCSRLVMLTSSLRRRLKGIDPQRVRRVLQDRLSEASPLYSPYESDLPPILCQDGQNYEEALDWYNRGKPQRVREILDFLEQNGTGTGLGADASC